MDDDGASQAASTPPRRPPVPICPLPRLPHARIRAVHGHHRARPRRLRLPRRCLALVAKEKSGARIPEAKRWSSPIGSILTVVVVVAIVFGVAL